LKVLRLVSEQLLRNGLAAELIPTSITSRGGS
jgi:hypothetical protein